MSRRSTMLLGWDATLALVIAIVLIAILPQWIPVRAAKDIYALSASVLSIVFSVFTASLAILLSSPDDKFVMFLETEGFYKDILWGFVVTLLSLVIALTYAIVGFGWTAYQDGIDIERQHRSGLIICAVLVTYSLAATVTSALASIRYARMRARFLARIA